MRTRAPTTKASSCQAPAALNEVTAYGKVARRVDHFGEDHPWRTCRLASAVLTTSSAAEPTTAPMPRTNNGAFPKTAASPHPLHANACVSEAVATALMSDRP